MWWVLWVLSTAAVVFAIATSFTTDAQGIADNTVTTMLAYLLALAAVLALPGCIEGSSARRSIGRPIAGWWSDRSRPQSPPPESPAAVEPEGQEPAA